MDKGQSEEKAVDGSEDVNGEEQNEGGMEVDNPEEVDIVFFAEL